LPMTCRATARFHLHPPWRVKMAMNVKSGLVDVFPMTDIKLAADFVAWAASEEASFFGWTVCVG